jgi:5-methyltetrahydrofolate--homocysteine methyltransferase
MPPYHSNVTSPYIACHRFLLVGKLPEIRYNPVIMNTRPPIQSLLGRQLLFFDGATGSVLQSRGLIPGELPERWNITHPDEIVNLHYAYFRSGANIVKTNTFGAFSTKFPAHAAGGAASRVLSASGSLEEVVKAAVANAQKARSKIESEMLSKDELEGLRAAHLVPDGIVPALRPHYIAFDIGPCGKLLRPMGDLDFEDAVSLFKQTFRIGLSCGVDAVLIETMNDCYEAKAAVLAAKEVNEELNLDIPVFATTVYDENGRLLTGADPETMTAVLEGLGVDAFGMNCSLGPEQMAPLVPLLTAAASIPVIVNPNAGLPRSEGGKTVYDVPAERFSQIMTQIAESGADLLGGCCGTNPEYICRMVNALQDRKASSVTEKNDSVIASYTHTVHIGGNYAPVLIGERINPTGKKKFKEALRANDIPYIISQGLEQETKGVHVLDVNVGLPEIDEKKMMVTVTGELQAVCDLPLQIDTSSPAVMEAALRRYNGKALINSVNGKQEVMHEVFPLVKKYGGVVVALTIDEDGIPDTAEGRLAVVKKLYDTAAQYGIGRKNIIIDPLAMAVSSDDKAPPATLETVRAVHDAGGSTILGVSNVSFGLPERELVTAAFFTMAMQNGLSAAIMNPLSAEMQKAYSCYCVLSGHDSQCAGYISFAEKYAAERKKEIPTAAADKQLSALRQIAALAAAASGGMAASDVAVCLSSAGRSSAGTKQTGTDGSGVPVSGNGVQPDESPLKHAIIRGLKNEAAAYTKELIKTAEPLAIIDGELIPALDVVGKGFEAKKVYLPQLLMSADAAAAAFAVIKGHLAKTGTQGKSRGTIIVATVKGDIHDIGKNIVKVLLENYDFTVIDLGKDVPPETVVERCIQDHVMLVGLSALMTTTVPSMEETIKQLRQKAPWAKVCVGGAVMTQEYADMIHADFYGKDAMATVKYAQSVFAVV